jgi:predicted RNase H-like nuclease (RuvC/YqgF family)
MDVQKIKTAVKENYKVALYVIAGFVLLYGIIYITTRKPQMPAEYKTTIDSLVIKNKELEQQQKQLDSTIQTYKARVEQVDTRINNIKEKTTIVKEYYHEQIQTVSSYTPTQLDSFFKARYDY